MTLPQEDHGDNVADGDHICEIGGLVGGVLPKTSQIPIWSTNNDTTEQALHHQQQQQQQSKAPLTKAGL